MKFRSNPGALYVWNVPIPPPLGQCRFLPPSLPVSGRLHAVELAGCTGITFFMRGGTYAVHGHTRAAPSAERTYHRLERRRREPVAWVYVPLPQEDRLLSFGIRKPLAGKNYRFLVWLIPGPSVSIVQRIKGMRQLTLGSFALLERERLSLAPTQAIRNGST